jgi:MoaA/NifB/PqqE/SkfB family radical SAM enzyme
MDKDYNFIVKLTTSCPGNCKCCVNRRESFTKKRNNQFFDIDLFRDICKKTKEIGGKYICFSGGEPTIVPNLSEYVQIAKKTGLASRINTNGWEITEPKLREYLEKGLDQVVISVYGVTKEIITRTRGNPLLYERTNDACKVLKKLKEKYNYILILQTIIMRDNYTTIPQILKKAIDMNADFFWPSYLEDAFYLEDIRMRPEDIEIFCEEIKPQMKEILTNNGYSFLVDRVDKIYSEKYLDYIYHKDKYDCPLLGRHLTFYPNGVVDPCPGHEYFSSDAQVNIIEEGVENVVSEKNLESNKNHMFEYCQYCPHGEHVGFCFHEKEISEHSKSNILKKD